MLNPFQIWVCQNSVGLQFPLGFYVQPLSDGYGSQWLVENKNP